MADKAWSVSAEALVEVVTQLDLVPSTMGVLSGQFVLLTGKAPGRRVNAMLSSLLSGSFTLKGDGLWPFEDKINVDRRLFFPFVQVGEKMKNKAPFEFTKGKKELHVRHGRRKAVFTLTTGVAGYGQTPKTEEGYELSSKKEFWELIRCLRTCASTDPTVPHLNCVYMRESTDHGKVDIFASNEYIAAWATHHTKTRLKKDLAFPLYLLEKVGSTGMRRIVCQEKQVVLEFNHGVLWEQMPATAAKKFPVKAATSRFAATGNEKPKFAVDCKRLGAVCSRLETYLAAVNRKEWVLDITGVSGSSELLFSVEVPQGSFRERVRADSELATSVKVTLPLSALMSVMGYMAQYEEGALSFRYSDKSAEYRLDTKHLHILVGKKAEK